MTYAQELFHWKMELEERKRNFFVFEEIFSPENEEIRMAGAKNYTDLEQMVLDLALRLKSTGHESLDHQVRSAFVKQMTERDSGNRW